MNNFAVSSDGLATALQTSASALMSAGNDLNQSVALVAAANKVLQDPSQVGSALRTIALRIRGTSVEVLEEMGEETDGVIESVSKLQEKVKAISGVDILDDTGAYRDTYDILKDIAEVWDEIGQKDPKGQAALLEMLAGKNRSNALAAILTNLDDLEGAYESAMQAQGSAEAENEKYLNSIQGKIDQFNNALQTMWQSELGSDIIKTFVDIGTSIIQLIDKVGILRGALLGLATVFAGKALFGALGLTGIKDITAAMQLLAAESVKTGESMLSLILTESALSIKTKLAESSLIKYAIANGIASASNVANMTTMQLLNVAVTALIAKLKAAWAAMLGFAAANPVLVVIAAALAAVGIGFAVAAGKAKKAEEDIKATYQALSETREKLKELESELGTISKRIDELNGKDSLTFTEEEELKKLQAQKTELERIIALEKEREKRQAKKVGKTFIEQIKNTPNLNDKVIPTYYNKEGKRVDALEANVIDDVSGEKILKEGYTQGEGISALQRKIELYQQAKEAESKARQELAKAMADDKATDKELKKFEKNLSNAEEDVKALETSFDGYLDAYDDLLNQEGVEWQFAEPGKELEDWQVAMNEQIQAIYDAQDAIAIAMGADNAKGKALDRIFNITGTNDEGIQKLQKIAEETQDVQKVIDGLNGNPILLEYFKTLGIEVQDVANYLLHLGSFDGSNVIASFDITDYTKSIGTLNDQISAYQDALNKLNDGSFTMGDYVELIEEFPDLAKGVDVSSKSFNGLTKNLRKAINSKPKELIKSLQELKKSLKTKEEKKQVEELIKALKELGKIKFDSLEDELFSLEQALQKASELGNALENAMDLNPNKNYDTVKDALGEIQGLLDVGKIGSYSPIWDMIEALAGPEAATALRNAENIGQAVQDWINVRRGYYPEEEGFDSQQAAVKFFQDFISFTDQAVKAAAAAGDEAAQKFADAFTFDENGDMKLDLPNESWDEYLDFLNQYSDGFKALNMSAGEFAALMMNMGQYNPNLDLQDFRDLKDFLDSILESGDAENILAGLDNVLASINKRLTDNGKEPIDWDNILNSEDLAAQRAKIEETLKSLNIDPKIISNLMDSIANAFKFKDGDPIAQAQTKIQSLVNEVNNLLKGKNLEPIDWDKILEADGVDAQMKLIEDALNKLNLDPSKFQEYVDAFKDYLNQIDALKNAQNVLEDEQNRYIQKAGETTEATEQTTEAVKELKNVIVTTTPEDPLGIKSLMGDIASLEGYLTALEIKFESFTDEAGNTTLTLNTDDLIRKLDEAGLTTDEISQKLAYLENQEGIKLDVDASELTPEKIQEKIDASTEGKDIELKVNADIVQASTKLQELQAQIDALRQLVSANPISLDIDMGDTSWEDLLKLGSAKLLGEGEATSATLDSLETLLEKLNEIKTAIDAKTEAFRTEGTEIPPLIQAEVDALENLRAKLAEIVGTDSDVGIAQELNSLINFDFDGLTQSLERAADALADFQEVVANVSEINLNLTGSAFNLTKLQDLQNKVNNIYTRFNLIKGLNPIGLDVTISYGKAMAAAREINDIIKELKDSSPVEIDIELPEDLELEELEEKDLKFDIDTSQLDAAISAYNSLQNKTVTVTLAQNPTDIISVLQSMKAAIDALSDKTYTITEIFRRIIITTMIGGGRGGAGVNGTAHVQGTAHASGTAHKGGDWGIKKDETALVGELGEELVVRGNKWFTVGDNGAEFTSLQKGDIVFNHKQTQDLLSKGYVAGRGRAVAQGTAHAEGTAYASGSGWNGSYQGSHSGGGDDDNSDDYEEVIDWFEILLEEINEQLDLMNAKLENAVGISAKKSLIGQILSVNHDELGKLNEGLKLYTDYAAKLLNNVPEQYRDAVQNGAVDITEFFGEANKDTVEAINKYRDWAKKIADVQQQLEEVKTTISDLRVDALDMINTEYENAIGLITIVNDKIKDTIDLLEAQGERVSANYYTEMIKNSEDQLKKLQEQRAAMQAEFNEAVASGDVKKYSENWYDMLNSIYDVDEAIIDCKKDIEGFDNAILDLHWENFEKIVTALDAISDEAEQVRSVIRDTEITDELGNWTKLGITALGMASQEMETAKYRADLYGEQIEVLNKQFAAGKYSQDEYREKLQELKEAQWDSIEAYESAKDTIVELNRARVEAVKDGLQKEIDKYEELINKRKEDLQAQKDAHDWASTLKTHTDEIDKIQRQIDAMAGDTSAAAIAQRKKLEEQLAEAQADLDETYYNRDIEQQQKALDDSLEAYRKDKEDKMEELDKYLEQEDQVIKDSYALILANTESVSAGLQEISERYGISISKNVTDPWIQGTTALGTYETELNYATSAYVDMLERVRKELIDIQVQADKTAESLINGVKTNITNTQGNKPTQSTIKQSAPASPSLANGAIVTVKKSATNFARDGGNGTRMQSWVPGSSFTVYQTAGDQVLLGIPGKGYTGWVRKQDLVGYAKGTTGVKNDQLAWIDENGLEELVMHADGNGKLAFLSKGTSVIPSDISENLMKLGSIDPTEMLKRNTPSIGAPHIIENNMQIDMSIAEVVHIEHADRDSIPDIQNAVKNQLDSYMKALNSKMKGYTR